LRSPKSVYKLSNAQLEKKIANDRQAQRATRERRKKIEEQVPKLIEREEELERQMFIKELLFPRHRLFLQNHSFQI
jgi:hypothetical protein